MRFAYVDTSCLVAVALSESGYQKVAERLASCQSVYSSNLLEAELKSALTREGETSRADQLLKEIRWVHPERPLGGEIQSVLRNGHVRGADTWHLACALYLGRRIKSLGFLTLDQRQLDSAARLGFEV